MTDHLPTSRGPISYLDLAIPVFLPGSNRDWMEHAGICKISTEGKIYITLQDESSALMLAEMALEKTLLQVAFDYKMTPQQTRELNERYTKKIVSRVGTHPITHTGKDVGTAYIFTDGTLEVKLDGNPLTYLVDTTKKKDNA